jgi:hypothetical protein
MQTWPRQAHGQATSGLQHPVLPQALQTAKDLVRTLASLCASTAGSKGWSSAEAQTSKE